SSFVFAATITEAQRLNRLEDIQRDVKRSAEVDAILSEVITKLEGMPDEKIYPGKWTMETSYGRVEYMMVASESPPPRIGDFLVVFTNDDEPLHQRERCSISDWSFFNFSVTISKLRTKLIRWRSWKRYYLDRARQMENLFRTGSPLIWSFTDFLYFSTIIQSTVGLGDIQPNSTQVRAIVMVQILIGYAILIVLLNIMLGWEWKNG